MISRKNDLLEGFQIYRSRLMLSIYRVSIALKNWN